MFDLLNVQIDGCKMSSLKGQLTVRQQHSSKTVNGKHAQQLRCMTVKIKIVCCHTVMYIGSPNGDCLDWTLNQWLQNVQSSRDQCCFVLILRKKANAINVRWIFLNKNYRNLYQSKEFLILNILICVLRLSTLWFSSYDSIVPMVLLMFFLIKT